MTVHELAGKPAPRSLLTNIPRLVTAYYVEKPDVSDPTQRVAFGTSGHRGSSCPHRGWLKPLALKARVVQWLAVDRDSLPVESSRRLRKGVFSGWSTQRRTWKRSRCGQGGLLIRIREPP
jgi:hypothetical protein